jgi:hypothetical protein
MGENSAEIMRTFLATIGLALLLAVAYLQASRSIAIKRWLLPVTAAGLAAIFAACFSTYVAGGTSAGYAVGLPLGLSAGCLLHHLLEYCHRCGATPSLLKSVQALPHHVAGARRCHHCLDAFRR